LGLKVRQGEREGEGAVAGGDDNRGQGRHRGRRGSRAVRTISSVLSHDRHKLDTLKRILAAL
ncbi:MAG: hypothetical protein ACK2UO_02295, partial [Caldilineaceae bacterium]